MAIQRRPKPISPEEFIEGANFTETTLQSQVEVLEQKLQEQAEREQKLIREIEQLRVHDLGDQEKQLLQNQISELREHLKQNQGAIPYPVDKICPNPKQTRQTFKEEVAAMEQSLQKEGQLDDVMLFSDGTLFDGECRWRAACNLGWQTINAVFVSRPSDDKALRRRTYLANRHRRDLNALDKAESMVAIVCDEVPELNPEEVPRIVNRVLTRLKRKQQKLGERLHIEPQEKQTEVLSQLGLDSVEMQVFLILLGLQEHPATLNRNVFPTLSLMPDLKAAVREKTLGCPQALVLNRLSAESLNMSELEAQNLRQEGVALVLKQNLSEIKIQQWVGEQKRQHHPDSATSDETNVGRNKQVDTIITAVQQMDFTKVNISPEQRHQLRQALEEVLQML